MFSKNIFCVWTIGIFATILLSCFGCSSKYQINNEPHGPCAELFGKGELDPWLRFEKHFPIYQGGVLWYTEGHIVEEGFQKLFEKYGVVGYKILNCGDKGNFVWVPGIVATDCKVYNMVRDQFGHDLETPIQLVVQYEFGRQKKRL